MKNNRILRVAAFLLIAVMITACTISGTFAKYVTGDNDEDSARVAKWGVTVTAFAGESDSTAFANEYNDGTTVKSTSGDVIAPGTDGTLATVTIGGTAEVAAKVSATVTLTLTNWTVGGEAYCPITFTVNETEFTIKTAENETVQAFADRVAAAIKTALGDGETVAPGATLGKTLTVDWEWPESVDDAKDTALGGADPAPTINFIINVSVEQVV